MPGTTDCRVVYTVSPDGRSGRGHRRREPDDRELGAHFNRFVVPARRREDRLRREPAEPSAARDRELHAGLARRARRGRGRRARDRRVRAHEHPRPRADPRRARGDRRRAPHLAACPGRTPCARPGAGSDVRRPSGCSGRFDALHFSRLDVPAPAQRASARRRSTTSCRSTIPSGRRARTRSMHSPSTGTRPRPATSSSSTPRTRAET